MRTRTRVGAAVALTAAALALVLTGCQGSVTSAGSGPPPSAPSAAASAAPAPSAAASSEPVPSAEPVPTVPVPTVPALPSVPAVPTVPVPTLPAVSAAPPISLPAVFIVRLSSGFSPATMHIGVGQRFLLLVSATVNAAVAGTPASCPLGATSAVGADLSVQCGPTGTYLFTGEHAGTAVVTAVVKPTCTPGTACPDWVTDARLTVTITT